ncbi:hypothetical protein BCR35DRAFT_187804 [Leucosporidium creatinivorum]|uniref:Uncharacterized protein n=1 Tax=Leucosporidium creatinivorum TaxID=106004 RepID=A0A1Y2DWM2_9BASI|nr:hypothetical protein BCR35DRAFT_187804 [Leucosporidium creatinivorum]
MITQEEADAAFAGASLETLDPTPTPRLYTWQVKHMLHSSQEIAHCWIVGGISTPLFGPATLVARDEAHNVLDRAQRVLHTLGTRGEFEYAFNNLQEDHEFLNQFVRDTIDHDHDMAMFDFTHEYGNVRGTPVPPFIQLMHDETAGNQMHSYCQNIYNRSLRASATTKSVNGQLHCGLRDWFFLNAWQRGQVLLAAKNYFEWIREQAQHHRRPSTHHGQPGAGSAHNPIHLASLSRRQARRSGVSQAALRAQWQ